MFDKGKHFLAAAVLLDQKNGHKDVILHLGCQGLEIIQKGLLLAKDYDHYMPRLKSKKELGHDLIKGAEALQTAYQFKPLTSAEKTELQEINAYYRESLLRYVAIHDIIGGHELKVNRVMRRAVALSKLGERVFN